jgi:membrane-bound lytic murein transglycosylase B
LALPPATIATEAGEEDEEPRRWKAAMMRTITFPLRKTCSALSALALISGGIVLSDSAKPAPAPHLALVSSHGPAIVVPDIAMTQARQESSLLNNPDLFAPAGHAPATHAPAPGAPPAAPAPLSSMLAPGTVPGSSQAVTSDGAGIPVRALEGYRRAAALTGAADPSCHIDWALLAAIGRVESNHARFSGNQLNPAGLARPGIFGIALNGANGTALIPDTDHGLLDRDLTYDRAVGPMQFIPSTWRLDGVDADGDGVKNPQDMADAATATAIYLCSGPGDLRRPADLGAAILRYNDSDSYVHLVTSIADAYRHGVTALAASDLTPASPTPEPSTAKPAAIAATPAASGPAPARPRATNPTKASGQHQAPAPQAVTTSARTSVPAAPRPPLTASATASSSSSSSGPSSPEPSDTPSPAGTLSPSAARSGTAQPNTVPGDNGAPTTTMPLCESGSGDVLPAAKPTTAHGTTTAPTPARAACCTHHGDLDHGSKHAKIRCTPPIPMTVLPALP